MFICDWGSDDGEEDEDKEVDNRWVQQKVTAA